MKHTKEYAEKIAKNIYPDGSYWIGSAETARLYDYNLADRTKFIEGYMKAIEETNVAELLQALKIIVDFPNEDLEHYKTYGVTMSLNELQFNQIINAIKKAE